MTCPRSLILLGLTALLMAACTETRQDLGLGRNPPDEFAVVERPPLSMPPDYSIQPPRPGAPRPQNIDTAQQASEVLFSNGTAPSPVGQSSAEKALLEASNAGTASADIRSTVDHEAAQKVVASPHLVERLTNWSDKEKPGVTVDAEAEAARIRKAMDDKQPINAGATPIIEKQSSGWLGL